MSENTEKLSLPPDLYARNTVISFLAGKVCKKTRPAILDVGGYNGKLASFFSDYSKFVILDRKGKPKDETCEYKQADAKKIPFSDRNFDIVVASDFIEHVPEKDRPQVIKEMLRVSKNYLIMGAPLKSRLVQTAEEQIKSQFFANAGTEHPFLIEHETAGLPDEEDMDRMLTEAGVKFMKVREGNLMNWYLQQLYAGTHWGETDSFDKYGFYTFYNEHIFELGDLRQPTYRTIYLVAGDGVLPETEIYAELQAKFTWNTETFMQLMRLAFDDLRFVIDRKKEVLVSLETELAQKDVELAQKDGELTGTLAKAKKSVDAYREAVTQLRDFLQEKEQALNFLKTILKDKDARLAVLEKETLEQADLIKRLDLEVGTRGSELDKLRTHAHKTERILQERLATIETQKRDLRGVSEQLDAHRASLDEVRASRAWKAVMVYSGIKTALLVRPAKLVKKGWKIWKILGPKVFIKRFARKIKRQPYVAPETKGYDLFIRDNEITQSKRRALDAEARNFQFRPLISVVMPVYNIDEKWLVKAIESVRSQIYDKWELCVCDDASTAPHIKPLLEKYARRDSRIKVAFRQKNGGIVKASNQAIKLAAGTYLGLLDDDDELAPDALCEVVKALQEKKYDLIYSDEDKIGEDGLRYDPFFKPDWSADLLFSCNYISHFGVYRRKIIDEIGGFREGFDGSQDYDLVLRFTEKTREIKHIPKVLYHWRAIKGSAAGSIEAKPYAYEAAKKALNDALKRRKIDGEVIDGLWTGSYRLRRNLHSEPLVSIIIPFKDKKDVLERCLMSILEKTTYSNYEILLVNNRSELLGTADYLLRAVAYPRVRLVDYDAPFNFAAINNFAVGQAKGDYLILLNNDTEVITPGWIEAMLEHARRGKVGAVGAKLLFPDSTVQHAGVLMGLGGLAGHAFSRATDLDHGYFGLVDVIRNYTAVTGACMMVKKSVYLAAGGLDENNLAVAFNDVDFCLKLREKGLLIVYTPYAVLTHHESLSRGYEMDLQEVAFMQRKYAGLLKKGDPYYNPNLTLERGDFSLRVMDKVK